MKDVGVAFFNAAEKIGVTAVICATICVLNGVKFVRKKTKYK